MGGGKGEKVASTNNQGMYRYRAEVKFTSQNKTMAGPVLHLDERKIQKQEYRMYKRLMQMRKQESYWKLHTRRESSHVTSLLCFSKKYFLPSQVE